MPVWLEVILWLLFVFGCIGLFVLGSANMSDDIRWKH